MTRRWAAAMISVVLGAVIAGLLQRLRRSRHRCRQRIVTSDSHPISRSDQHGATHLVGHSPPSAALCQRLPTSRPLQLGQPR